MRESHDSLKMSFNNSAVAYLLKVSAVGDTFPCNQTRSNFSPVHVSRLFKLGFKLRGTRREKSWMMNLSNCYHYGTGLNPRKFYVYMQGVSIVSNLFDNFFTLILNAKVPLLTASWYLN